MSRDGESVCQQSGKTGFKHYQAAAQALGHWFKRSRGKKGPRTVYRCEHCDLYHLTSLTPEISRALSKARKAEKARKVHK